MSGSLPTASRPSEAAERPKIVTMTKNPVEQRDPVLGRDGYVGQLVELLFERLREVIRLRQPEIEACLVEGRPLEDLTPALQLRALQAWCGVVAAVLR